MSSEVYISKERIVHRLKEHNWEGTSRVLVPGYMVGETRLFISPRAREIQKTDIVSATYEPKTLVIPSDQIASHWEQRAIAYLLTCTHFEKSNVFLASLDNRLSIHLPKASIGDSDVGQPTNLSVYPVAFIRVNEDLMKNNKTCDFDKDELEKLIAELEKKDKFY